jgi:hypothetical protein
VNDHDALVDVGRIVRLQVQTASLKVGATPRRYDPTPLRALSALRLTAAGVCGGTAEEPELIDVHHRDHPESKHRGGANGIALGFTSHYHAMRDRFGPHLGDGIAGENLLVATEAIIAPDALADGIVITNEDGQQLMLCSLIVAAPCVEFARFALRLPDAARPDRTVTAALQFLHQGMRGYYATLAGDPATVRVGDRVYRVRSMR